MIRGIVSMHLGAFLFSILISATAYGVDATSFNPTTITVTAQNIGVPVGTIITWPVSSNPEDMTNWLECNGQSISRSSYPELYAVVGGNVPDLQGRFIQNNGAPGQKIEAGLPNITGSIQWWKGTERESASGVFSMATWESIGENGHTNHDYSDARRFDFDASRANPIYGRSSTVQPAAYTVRFLIRARP